MRAVHKIPEPADSPPKANLADYLTMARPDHWIKHIFIVPGLALAQLMHPVDPASLIVPILVGFASASAIASANYVLNEWLDQRFDRHHPMKSSRAAVQKRVAPQVVLVLYASLAVAGLLLAGWVSLLFFVTSVTFLVSGLVYNVPGVRTKDRVYLDVLSEAVNNPIRLTLGWAMVWPQTMPPSSLFLAYWMGGAFLMAIKRLAELRHVAETTGLKTLGLYRRSFRFYTENRLLVSAFLYAQLAAFFLAVFLIKYRVEYLLALPLFALLFATYLAVGLKRQSTAQAPERLFREKALVGVVGLLAIALVVLSWVDIPALERLSTPHYLAFPFTPRP